jgi:uncharacterized protein (TIGR02266 family)
MSSKEVMHIAELARRARSALGSALEALQSASAEGQLFGVAEPLATSLGICARIEAEAKVTAGAGLGVALESIRRALQLLQQPDLQRHSLLLDRATAGVAEALAALHELERAEQAPSGGSVATLAGTHTAAPAASTSDELCVEAALGAHSTTNFYRGLSPDDVLSSGGLFVATYLIPSVGQRLKLKVSMPGGYEFEASGVVAWIREPRPGSVVPGAPPGFGARLTELSDDARQLVQRYVNNREPLLLDDL